jgi:hypothetical protein
MSYDLRLADGNLVIGSNGDLGTVQSSDKLVQDVLKMAITPQGANRTNPWYGTLVGKTLIGSALDLNFAKSRAADQLFSALEILRSLQISQQEYQNVSASEAILRVASITVDQSKNDRRLLLVSIVVLARSGASSKITFNVRI